MELNIDTLQLFQNRDLVDYLNIIFQGLIAVGTLIAAIGIGSWVRNITPKKENVKGKFTFETNEEPYRVILGLRNTGKNRIDFDPKQGVYIQWESAKSLVNAYAIKSAQPSPRACGSVVYHQWGMM